MDCNRWITFFLTSIVAERGAAKNTIDAYQRDLMHFEQFLAGQKRTFAQMGRSEISDYLLTLTSLAASSRARRLSAIRQLFRFAADEGWITHNPAARLSGPRKSRNLPQTLTENQVGALLDAAGKVGTSVRNRIRNTCLIEILYATGMRASELVSLPVASGRGDPDMILVKGKGGKERIVPLSKPAKIALADWLLRRDRDESFNVSQGSKSSPYLFPAASKTGHMTRERFFLIIKELALVAGISPASVSPHTLRHAFATHLLANGADLRVIQTLLGHADVATTEIYTHVIDEKLRELVLTKHPLA